MGVWRNDRQSIDDEPLRPRRAVAIGLYLCDRRADHERGERAGAFGARIADAHHLAAPQDGRAFAQAFHFIELVGNVEQGAALGLQLVERDEQRLDLSRRQHGRWFVQHDKSRVLQQTAGDLDALSFSRRKGPDLAIRLERQAIAARKSQHLFAQVRQVARFGQRERDVLRHGQVVEQREMLKHHAYAARARVVGVGEQHGFAVDGNRALGGFEQAIEHLDQRRLARAVLANEGVRLMRVNIEIDVIVGDEIAKALDDAPHRNERGLARRLFRPRRAVVVQ